MMSQFRSFSQIAAWTGMAVILILLLGWAFRSLLPGPQPATTPSPSSVPATATPAITPTAALGLETQSPTLEAASNTPAPSPTPATEPSETPVAPLMTGAGFRDVTWSPDGAWLSFLSQTPEDVARSPGGEGYLGPFPGTVHFLNVRTGERCQHPEDNAEGLVFILGTVWLPDGRLGVLSQSGELVALQSPCASDTVTTMGPFPERIEAMYGSSQDNTTLLLRGETRCWLFDALQGSVHPIDVCSRDLSFSPAQSLLGMTISEDGINYTTQIVALSTGERAYTLPWRFSEGGLGSLPGPIWIDEQRFVVYRTDEGPLLVTLGEPPQIQAIAPDFFGIPGAAHQTADAAAITGSDAFHILLNDYGPDYSETTIWLYHSETGETEAVPYAYAYFSSEGDYLDLRRSVNVEGFEQLERWSRPIDPPGSAAQPAIDLINQDITAQSRSGELAATASEPTVERKTELTIQSVADGAILQAYPLGEYYIYQITWSPDQRWLAAEGYTTWENQALFLIPYPDR